MERLHNADFFRRAPVHTVEERRTEIKRGKRPMTGEGAGQHRQTGDTPQERDAPTEPPARTADRGSTSGIL